MKKAIQLNDENINSYLFLDYIKSNGFDENNYNNHAFERIFYNFQRQQFNGPSHVDKDKILSMTTILMKGDWKKCVEEVKKLNLIKKYNYLQDKLFELIKRTALKCYIIFYMNEFQSFELNKLSTSFDIDLEIISIADSLGYKLAELPIPTRYAGEKSNLNVVTYGLRVLRQVFRRFGA